LNCISKTFGNFRYSPSEGISLDTTLGLTESLSTNCHKTCLWKKHYQEIVTIKQNKMEK